MVTEIELGKGNVKATIVAKGNRQGVLIRPCSEPSPIGSYSPVLGDEDVQLRPDDVVIWISNPESGEIFGEILYYAIHKLRQS